MISTCVLYNCQKCNNILTLLITVSEASFNDKTCHGSSFKDFKHCVSDNTPLMTCNL